MPPSDRNIEFVPTGKLLLDERNPRLAGLLAPGEDLGQEELLIAMRDQMALDELAASIAAVGFYPHEPLFAEARSDGKYVVIEGNRRLATVKLLLDGDLREKLRVTSWPSPKNARALDALRQLPVWITTRKEAWQAIGFKHVNGPLRWGSYEKAQYAAQLHREYGIPLKEIARNIGDNHNTVARHHRALMVVEQAEREKVFNRDDRARPHFSFSHLYTGLDYPEIAEFIGLNRRGKTTTESPVPKEKKKELGELLVWIYGSRKRGIAPRVLKQNPGIIQLNRALETKRGLEALRGGASLPEADDTATGDFAILRHSLQKAKEHLQKAAGKISGYKGERETLGTAETVFDLANEILRTLERKTTRSRSGD